MIRLSIIAWLLIWASVNGQAQTMADTLKEAEIKAQKTGGPADDKLTSFSKGQRKVAIDSLYLEQMKQQNLAVLLGQRLPVFVKSYGLNGLATLNFRGSSAAQSAVYWKGFPLQNAALGIADISSIPVQLFSEVDVVYGGSSALLGSGNIGGAVMLGKGRPAFESGKTKWTGSSSLTLGSFGQQIANGGATARGKNIVAGVSINAQESENNFRYYTVQGKTERQQHAHLGSFSGLAELRVRLGRGWSLDASRWQQYYDREIPAASFESGSTQSRVDRSARNVVQLENGGRHKAYVKAGQFVDWFSYRNPSIGVETKQQVTQTMAEAGIRAKAGKHVEVLVFAPVQVAKLERKDQAIVRWQRRYALAGAATFLDLPWHGEVSLQGRVEQIDHRTIWLGGAGAVWRPRANLSVQAGLQRSYRAPTLNELYYDPGGNPRLNPEAGWSYESGLKFGPSKKAAWRYQGEATAYYRRVDDWIIWFGGSIWTPHNIATVASRGVETEHTLSYEGRKTNWQVLVSGAYQKATTLSSYQARDGSIGKIIPYTPQHLWRAQVTTAGSRHLANLHMAYNGSRYFNTDETGYLRGYFTLGMYAQYVWIKRAGFESGVHVQVENLLDARYEVVNGRPMPGISFLAGGSIRIR